MLWVYKNSCFSQMFHEKFEVFASDIENIILVYVVTVLR